MSKNSQKALPDPKPAVAKKKLSGKWSRSADALVRRKSKGLRLPGANGGRDPATEVS